MKFALGNFFVVAFAFFSAQYKNSSLVFSGLTIVALMIAKATLVVVALMFNLHTDLGGATLSVMCFLTLTSLFPFVVSVSIGTASAFWLPRVEVLKVLILCALASIFLTVLGLLLIEIRKLPDFGLAIIFWFRYEAWFGGVTAATILVISARSMR